MNGEFSAGFFGEFNGQPDGVAFHHQVKVISGICLPQQQVADNAACQIKRQVFATGERHGVFDQRNRMGGQIHF